MITVLLIAMETLLHLSFQIDLCGMPNLIINRVIRREPVGLAYLKRFIMSSDLPTIPLPALSSMTLNFDASVSSSSSGPCDSQSLSMSQCAYMRSPDLLMNKSSKKTSATGNSQAAELNVSNISNNLQVNANNSCNKVEQQAASLNMIQAQQQQEDGSQLLTKSKKYIKDLTMAANHSSLDNSTTESNANSPNITFTISAADSDVSNVGSSTNRDTAAVGNTASTTGHQPSSEASNNSTVGGHNESVKVPPLVLSGQSDVFVSL